MRMKIVLLAFIALLTTGLLNDASAHGRRGGWGRPGVSLSIGAPFMVPPPVVVYGDPYYRRYPRYRSYGYYGGYNRGYYGRGGYGRGYYRGGGYGRGCRRW